MAVGVKFPRNRSDSLDDRERRFGTRPYENTTIRRCIHCDESLSPSDCIGGQAGAEPPLSAFLGHASDLFLDDQVHHRQLTSPVGAGSAEKCHSRTFEMIADLPENAHAIPT